MPLKGLKNVKKMTEDHYIKLNTQVRGSYFSALTEIIGGTPVDSGRARNNWFLSTGSPSSDSTIRFSGGNSEKQLNQMPKSVFNKAIFYTNNLPYIEKLEYGGHSKQMPNGWVRKALILLQNKIRSL